MILPTYPPPNNNEDQTPPPPSYQESVPSSQLLPRDRPVVSQYAPSVSSTSGSSQGRQSEPIPRLSSTDGKNLDLTFPEPTTGSAHSGPPPLPPKDKEKEALRDDPNHHAFDVFSPMTRGSTSTPTASTSQSPNSHSLKTSDPLNPAPPAFTRPTPKNYAYLPFKPMTMLAINSNLADSFPMIPPPINPEDDKQINKANPQHPFVSHDVTEDDWLNFLAGIRTAASNSNQGPKSFWAKMFLVEMNERDQRKRAIHFIDSWNHYFFHPRRMSVVLARGRKLFNGASGNHLHRRHSASHGRGKSADLAHPKGHRRRSNSTSSSSSDSSTSSSDSSTLSTASEPGGTPVPQTHAGYGSDRYYGGQSPGMGRGWGGRGCGSLSHHHHPHHHEWHGGRGRGWHHQGPPGPSFTPPIPGLGAVTGQLTRGYQMYHEQKQMWKAQKRTWKAEKRAIKQGYRQAKRSMKRERRQHKREAKAMKHYGGGSSHHRDHPWKLIISYHTVHRESEQS